MCWPSCCLYMIVNECRTFFFVEWHRKTHSLSCSKLFVYINHCCCLLSCISGFPRHPLFVCPAFREHWWLTGSAVTTHQWCHAVVPKHVWLETTNKLPRQTYTDATSSGLTRGHKCNVEDRQHNDLVRTLFHLRSTTLLLDVVCWA